MDKNVIFLAKKHTFLLKNVCYFKKISNCDQEFWLKATDASGAFITQPQTAVSSTVVYLGFTSGYGIETVEVFSVDIGSLLPVYTLLFEAP